MKPGNRVEEKTLTTSSSRAVFGVQVLMSSRAAKSSWLLRRGEALRKCQLETGELQRRSTNELGQEESGTNRAVSGETRTAGLVR